MELRRYEIILKTLLWHLNHFSSQGKNSLFYKAWEEKYRSQKSSSSPFHSFFVIFFLTAIIFFKELILIWSFQISSFLVILKTVWQFIFIVLFLNKSLNSTPKINHALKHFFWSPDHPLKQQKKKAAVKVCIIIECIKWFYYLRWQLLLWYENKKAKIAPYFISGVFSVYCTYQHLKSKKVSIYKAWSVPRIKAIQIYLRWRCGFPTFL